MFSNVQIAFLILIIMIIIACTMLGFRNDAGNFELKTNDEKIMFAIISTTISIGVVCIIAGVFYIWNEGGRIIKENEEREKQRQ